MMNPRLRSTINRIFPPNSFGRMVGLLASGTALGQIISICAMPFITRIYRPEEMGIIVLFQAFFSYWSNTLSLRYENALLVAEDDTESHFIHRIAFILIFFMSIISAPLLWALQSTNTLQFGLLPTWAPWIAVPIFFGYGLFFLSRSWALRAGLIKEITRATVIRSGVNSFSRIALGFFGCGVLGLFLTELFSAYSAMLKMASATNKYFISKAPVHFTRDNLIRTARKYIKYPIIETPSTWVDTLAAALPVPMIASLYGAKAAGLYGLARMLVGIPNIQIGSAVADVFQISLAKAVATRDRDAAKRIFYQVLKKLAIFGLIPMLAIIVLAPWLMPLVFGHQWTEAGKAAAAIAPWLYAALIVSPLSRALSVLQKQEIKIIYDIGVLALLLMAFYLAKHLQSDFIGFLLYISIANIIGYVFYAIIIVKTIEKYSVPHETTSIT